MPKQKPAHRKGGARPGAGRKPLHPEGAAVKVSAQLPVKLLRQLDKARGKKSRSRIIVAAIRWWLTGEDRR